MQGERQVSVTPQLEQKPAAVSTIGALQTGHAPDRYPPQLEQ